MGKTKTMLDNRSYEASAGFNEEMLYERQKRTEELMLIVDDILDDVTVDSYTALRYRLKPYTESEYYKYFDVDLVEVYNNTKLTVEKLDAILKYNYDTYREIRVMRSKDMNLVINNNDIN